MVSRIEISADEILSRFEGGESLQALLDYVAIKTQCLLKNRLIRKQIFALADALVEHRQLTSKEVKEILWAAGEPDRLK